MKYKPEGHRPPKVFFSVVDLDATVPDPYALRLLPGESARHFQVLPLEMEGTTLFLATARPGNLFIYDSVEFQVRRRIFFVIADADELRAAIDRAYLTEDQTGSAPNAREERQAYLERFLNPDLARRLSEFEDARRDALGSISSRPAKPREKK